MSDERDQGEPARMTETFTDGWCALHGEAQPSADALRRVREVSEPSSADDGGLYVAGWNAAMAEVRAVLDGES